MAAQGVTFDRACVNATICTPSRASLMTGTYPLVHRVLCHQNLAPKNLPQLAEVLSDAGYHSVAAGHYESTRDLTRGWRETIDIAGTPRLRAALRAIQTSGSQRVGWSAGETAAGPDESHAAVLNDELFAVLDRVDPNREPLFVHVAYLEPHPPYFTPRGCFDHEAMHSTLLPPVGEMSERPAWHQAMLKDFGSAEATEEDVRRMIGGYYGLIRYVDSQIDRLLQYLDRRGILENSWIIMTSDHGDYAGEKGFYTKSESAYECLQHVPLVIRGPGGRWHPGQRVAGLTELLDLFPTILTAAGQAVPRQAQGHDLVAWVDAGARTPLREATFLAVGGYEGHLKTTMPTGLPESGRRKGIVRSARSLDYVFIHDPDTGDEAYDLRTDPLELRNLLQGGRPRPAPVKQLAEMLDDWERACERKFHDLGVIPGDRNFNEHTGVTTGDPNWKPPAPGHDL
jgi:arylsulfatase A-like enzyme